MCSTITYWSVCQQIAWLSRYMLQCTLSNAIHLLQTLDVTFPGLEQLASLQTLQIFMSIKRGSYFRVKPAEFPTKSLSFLQNTLAALQHLQHLNVLEMEDEMSDLELDRYLQSVLSHPLKQHSISKTNTVLRHVKLTLKQPRYTVLWVYELASCFSVIVSWSISLYKSHHTIAMHTIVENERWMASLAERCVMVIRSQFIPKLLAQTICQSPEDFSDFSGTRTLQFSTSYNSTYELPCHVCNALCHPYRS